MINNGQLITDELFRVFCGFGAFQITFGLEIHDYLATLSLMCDLDAILIL